MHSVVEIVAGSEKNYSKCPLKKRPVHFKFDDAIVTTTIDDVVRSGNFTSEEPENLCVKKEEDSASSISEEINVKDEDCCEDEGVDIDDVDDDDEDELIDCEDLDDLDDGRAMVEKSAAASAVAAAVAAASVVVPTPTYPKYGMQPWNFHVSPYTAEFYRTINNPHLAQQISPLRGDLLSPSSPSDSIGSLSPPPHYLHGRANSVSPPVRSEIIHRPIGVRQHQPSSHPLPPHSHRFLPYHHQPIQYYHPQTYGLTSLTSPPTLHHHQQQQQQHQQHHHHHHHAPISPAYSDSSYFSMRSLTPESNCSSLPEDLSVKQMSKPLIEDPSSIHHRHSHLSHLHHHHHHRHSSHNHEKIDGNSTTIHSPNPASSVSIISSNSSSSSTTTTTNTNINSSSPNSNIKKEKISPPRYQCPDCQKSYSTFSGLTKHQQFHCPAAEGNQIKKSFSCKDCDKTYVSLGALKMHIRTHTLPCKCNICGKAFSRPWLLQGHIRTHTGEKPFSCQHCHRAFADRSNLRAHLQTHSDIKKYSCTSCSKTFSRMSLLTKHSEGGCVAGGGSGGSGAGIVSSTSSNSSSDQIYLSPSSSSYPEH